MSLIIYCNFPCEREIRFDQRIPFYRTSHECLKHWKY